MILSFEQFQKAAEEVERIIKLSPTIDDATLKSELENAALNVPREKKREFYQHMNSLLLNVLLNRLNILEKYVEQRAINARRIISKINSSI